jgi:hypothetical protein
MAVSKRDSAKVGVAVRRMLHVGAEIDEVRHAELDRSTHLRRLAEQRIGGRVRRVSPGLAIVGRGAEANEGSEDIPVEPEALGLEQTVGPVIPDAVVNEAPAGVATAVGLGVFRERADVRDG